MKERETAPKSFPERAKKTFWWLIKVGIIAGVSVAALKAAIALL